MFLLNFLDKVMTKSLTKTRDDLIRSPLSILWVLCLVGLVLTGCSNIQESIDKSQACFSEFRVAKTLSDISEECLSCCGYMEGFGLSCVGTCFSESFIHWKPDSATGFTLTQENPFYNMHR